MVPAGDAMARFESAGGMERSEPAGGMARSEPAGGMDRSEPVGAVPGGVREGQGMSRSLQYAQVISSPDEHPQRPGRSLVTTNHEVIRQWAAERQASPATIEGTERDGRAGVLTFDFPGWQEGGRLRHITWDEWFQTFDARRLNFIHQEQRSDGRQSNFFRLESPDREDA
jgi:hypothetical protein